MRRQVASLAVLAAFFASLALAQTAQVSVGAAVPPVIRFSGTLGVAPGRVSVTFGFYQDEVGGDPLWSESQTLAVDAAGRYSVVLGLTTALPAELFLGGEARWLDVAVEGLAPQPRRLLVSVPYALKAADADTIGGKPLSAFVLAGERTGVATDGLTYVDTRVLASGLAAGGSGPPSPPSGFGVAGTASGGAGTPGFIGMFTDATTLGNSVVYQAADGSIGVNTTTPAAGFHAVSAASPVAYYDVYSNALGALPVVYRAARGTPSVPTAVQTNDILGGLAVRGYGSTAFSTGRGQVMFKAAENWTDSAQGTYLQFTTTPAGGTGWLERIRVTPDGNVGIGTAAPGQKLSVAGGVESTTGGFRFPDGTTQTTAARSGAAYNNAFGVGSLGSVTSGTSNAAFGDGALNATTTGSNNVAVGTWTLVANTTGSANAAGGLSALAANTTGNNNTASGAWALTNNTSGSDNTATGYFALASNTTACCNTATGSSALYYNTTGTFNTANGYQALAANTTGAYNTASGYLALAANTTANYNTAHGYLALSASTSGGGNTATGRETLRRNTTGYNNVAVGSAALTANTTGVNNTAVGHQALWANSTGSNNIALGELAGAGALGDYNIYIGSVGGGSDNNTIRIGSSHTRTYIAGIRGVTTSFANAIPVLIDSNGQLGTASSSRRVKDDIADMADASRGLMQLRPVTFHYTSDQNSAGRTLQYGLIAEEVAEVYPGLVAHSADGQIETVMYQFLPPMLLNEVQKQQRTIDAQAARFEATANALKAENDALKAQVESLRAQVQQLVAAIERR
jgi:hypothetical protein